MRKIISVIILVVFVIGVVYIFATSKPGAVSPLVATSTIKTYTLAQIAVHSSQKSCWTTVNSSVYDVTSWINQHPGGPEAILSLCGRDGSSAFNDQHGGQARPAEELASFKIGILIK